MQENWLRNDRCDEEDGGESTSRKRKRRESVFPKSRSIEKEVMSGPVCAVMCSLIHTHLGVSVRLKSKPSSILLVVLLRDGLLVHDLFNSSASTTEIVLELVCNKLRNLYL